MSSQVEKLIQVGNVKFANNLPFSLLCGPCALESRDHALDMAEALHGITERLGIGLVYKSSFDKANRSSLKGRRGVGMSQALDIFAEIKEQFGLPIVTDVHESHQCAPVAQVADILQIPAYLCRQTDLLVAAAKTGKAVNIKKGQFLAPWDMKNVIEKIRESGNDQAMICERGTSFGYNTLVTDFRGLPSMASWGHPIIFDATHSVQQPGGQGGSTGGQREFVAVLARAAVALGIAGLFIETHDNPAQAFSDGPNMVPLSELEALLESLQDFDQLAKSSPKFPMPS